MMSPSDLDELRSATAAALLFALTGAALVLLPAGGGPLPSGTIGQTSPALTDVHPLAAHAWTTLNCANVAPLRAGVPRLQAEDLMRMSATMDELAARHGRLTICPAAAKRAASVQISS